MLRRPHDHHRALQARRNTAPSTNSPNGLNQNRHLMSASTPHIGAFARSLCWSSAGPDTARPLAQKIQPNLQKIGPANLNGLALVTANVAPHSPLPPRSHPTAP